MLSVHRRNREILLNTRNALESHVLGNLNGIGTPRSNHLTAWTYIVSVQRLSIHERCVAVKPTKFVCLILTELMVNLSSDDVL